VLVLDEPTTFLDIRHEMTTFELLRRLRGEGTTIVLATHNLNLAARYADELLLLNRGRLIARGSPADVLTAERMAEVYEWPVSILTHAGGAPQVDPRGSRTALTGKSRVNCTAESPTRARRGRSRTRASS
jgi:iron complex transport system ATP-binding protein